jgi:hypothetical protein
MEQVEYENQKTKHFQTWLNIKKYLQAGENWDQTIHNFSVNILFYLNYVQIYS